MNQKLYHIIIGNYYYDGQYCYLLDYYNLSLMSDELQSEFNEMIKSIEKYHGFYVGRYELGIDEKNDNIPTSKKAGDGVITANSSRSETYMWYGLYTKCKEYAPKSEDKSVVSNMIWGSQYDAIMNWLVKNNVNVNGSVIVDDSNETGKNENDLIGNIYDLYKCHIEWTQEGYVSGSYYSRIGRGGNNYAFYYPSYRNMDNTPISDYEKLSTRLTLYINN